jgi:hypothetical protein
MPAPGREAARGLLRMEDMLTRPARMLEGGGYGIPQAEERSAVLHDATALSERWRRQREALLTQARDGLPAPRRDALDATEANVAALGAQLRRRAAPAAPPR